MEDGSCCGIWGLTTPDCPHLERCEACYAPSRFGHEGYRAYFNDKEWDFAQTVGTFWTNVAGSGDPNCRDSPICGTRLWPKFESGEVTQQLGCTYIDVAARLGFRVVGRSSTCFATSLKVSSYIPIKAVMTAVQRNIWREHACHMIAKKVPQNHYCCPYP